MVVNLDTNNQMPSEAPDKSLKALKYIFLFAFVILIGMVGVFYYVLNTEKTDLENQLSELQKQEEKTNYESSFSNSDLDSAISSGENLLAQHPNDVANYILLANAYLQRGSVTFSEIENADKAIEILEKAITLDSRNSEVYRVLGYAYEIKQDYKQAQMMYNTSIEIDPLNDVAYGARGHMYYLMGNENLAEADFKKALDINPMNDKALLDLAGIYFRQGNVEVDIEEILMRAISVSDNNNVKAEAFQLLGSLYYSKDDFVKAEKQFLQAVELEERLAMAWVGLAMSKIMLLEKVSDEEFDASVRVVIDSIEKALTLNENLSRAYVAEAIISGYLGDYVAEKEAYQRALSVINKDITLSKNEKEELRAQIESLIKEL